MDLLTAIQQRHSVRSYSDQEIAAPAKSALEQQIATINKETGLHLQLITDEPKAFDSRMAHYGNFSGVTNYIALIGPKTRTVEEQCGYYGEQLVLLAQQLGLNTCWVALTFSKTKAGYQLNDGEKLCSVISIGYGTTQGKSRKSKTVADVSTATKATPDWFTKGVEAALLAPTAVNQQKFKFSLNGNVVQVKAGLGFYSNVDLGIVKYHFEIGAGTENFSWA